jgi:hypothetical protein
MDTIYQVSFFCHICGVENSFSFHCRGDYFAAVIKATTFKCPSGCSSSKMGFELTQFKEVSWKAAGEATNALFH